MVSSIRLAACSGFLSWGLGALLTLPISPGLAVEFPDGRVAFDHPPGFFEISNPYPDVWISGTTYFVVLQVPANAGASLQQLVIAQQPSQEIIEFIPAQTRAFRGKPNSDRLGLGAVTFDRQQQTLVVNFDPPVPPGTMVTVAVSPERNPQFEGIYLFDVTVVPTGPKPLSQRIGTGRLQFYRGGKGW
jgi:Protein of unknown function (DUF2808)